MAQLAAKKYADALFELAVEENAVDDILSGIKVVYDVLTSDGELLKTLLHPQVTSEEKIRITDQIFEGINKNITGLFNIVFKKNREGELIHILTMFMDLVRDHKGVVDAVVVTAAPLSDSQLDAIKQTVTQKTNKQVEISVKEDPELVGGFYVNAGGFVFDGTVKKQLQDIRSFLLESKLAQ